MQTVSFAKGSGMILQTVGETIYFSSEVLHRTRDSMISAAILEKFKRIVLKKNAILDFRPTLHYN